MTLPGSCELVGGGDVSGGADVEPWPMVGGVLLVVVAGYAVVWVAYEVVGEVRRWRRRRERERWEGGR